MTIIKRNKTTILGLDQDLKNLNDAIVQEATARATATGDLTTLETTGKDSLVVALNELFGALSDVSNGALYSDANLSDLTDVAVARENLDVYARGEVDTAIQTAQLGLGTNYDVATIAERDALTGLDAQDRVYVADDGDGKWAIYKPSAVAEDTGLVTGWNRLYDQDALENSISAQGIKAAYEENDDTNAYTDADKAKVGQITVTQPIDLDTVQTSDSLITDIEANPSETAAPSARAVSDFVGVAVAQGGGVPIMENLVVAGDDITLTHAPREGINGILNFATVRYTDSLGAVWDAPLLATVDPKVFTVSADSAGQWDTQTVQIQYFYSPSVDTVAPEAEPAPAA